MSIKKLLRIMSFKIGDKIAVTDETIRGEITAIHGNDISILTDDGFVLKYFKSELVKIEVEQSELFKKATVFYSSNHKVDYKKGERKVKTRKNKDFIPPMEVDLHIGKLTKTTRGMDNYDMLSLQVETAKYKLEFAIQNRIPRVIFIHGVGSGVLKQELDYLFGRYNVRVSEGNYQKYGTGATEVYLLQNIRE